MGGLKRRVLKFGGTSVGTAPALRSALGIAEAAARERPVVVVVSALSGVTDALEAALAGAAARRLDVPGFAAAVRARHLALLGAVAHGRPAARAAARIGEGLDGLKARLRSVAADRSFSAAARAGILALGERASAAIVVAALRARGVEADAVDGASLIRTDAGFAEAAVDYPSTRSLVRAAIGSLGVRPVPVVTGFVAGAGPARRRSSAAGGRTSPPRSSAGRSMRSTSRSGPTWTAS